MEPAFDGAWRARALRGDPAAIDLLVDHALPALHRFCLYRVGRDRELCQEVVHETLARAIRDLAHFDPERAAGRVLPWLTGLARNEVRRAMAARPRTSLDALWERMDRELLLVYAQLDRERLEEDELRRAEARELVNATMSQLPDHYREALEAKYVSDLSTRDLATSLGLSEHAAESLLARARKAFRATFLALVEGLTQRALEPIPDVS